MLCFQYWNLGICYFNDKKINSVNAYLLFYILFILFIVSKMAAWIFLITCNSENSPLRQIFIWTSFEVNSPFFYMNITFLYFYITSSYQIKGFSSPSLLDSAMTFSFDSNFFIVITSDLETRNSRRGLIWIIWWLEVALLIRRQFM